MSLALRLAILVSIKNVGTSPPVIICNLTFIWNTISIRYNPRMLNDSPNR